MSDQLDFKNCYDFLNTFIVYKCIEIKLVNMYLNIYLFVYRDK